MKRLPLVLASTCMASACFAAVPGSAQATDPADNQEEGRHGIQPDLILRLVVIPVGKTTLLAWARTSKANPDKTFFTMFERMLKSARFRW